MQNTYDSNLNPDSIISYGKTRLFLLVLFVLAAGMDFRTKEIGLPGSVNLLELLSFCSLALLLADAVIYPKQPFEMVKTFWENNSFLLLYAIWAFVAAVIGIVKSPNSMFIVRNLFPAFLFMLLASFSLRSINNIKMLMFVFLIAALPNLLLGLSQFLFNGPFPVAMNIAAAVKMDVDGSFVKSAVSGFYNHPNALSVFLMPVFLVSTRYLFGKLSNSFFNKLILLSIVAMSIAVLYFTKAKGAWMWGIYGVLIMFIPTRFLKVPKSWIFITFLLCLSIASVTLISLELGGSLKTMLTRIYLWNSAWYVFSKDPFVALLGSGQIDVWYASAKLADLQYPNAHNVFINQAVNFGLPAAFFYSAAVVLAIKKAQEAIVLSNDDHVIALSKLCIAALSAISGQYFFEPSAESSGLALELFLFVVSAGALEGLAKASKRLSK